MSGDTGGKHCEVLLLPLNRHLVVFDPHVRERGVDVGRRDVWVQQEGHGRRDRRRAYILGIQLSRREAAAPHELVFAVVIHSRPGGNSVHLPLTAGARPSCLAFVNTGCGGDDAHLLRAHTRTESWVVVCVLRGVALGE